MAVFPGSLVPWVDLQFHYADGTPLAGGQITFKVTGTNTLKNTYADANLISINPNPVICDAAGRATIFLQTGGYDVYIYDPNSVLLYTVVGVEDVGNTFLSALGTQFSSGASAVTSGYTVLPTDLTVRVNSTGGANPCIINLPTSASHPQPLCVKNMGNIALAVTPNGAEQIDAIAAVYTVTAGTPATPICPSIWLWPVTGGWIIAASHKL